MKDKWSLSSTACCGLVNGWVNGLGAKGPLCCFGLEWVFDGDAIVYFVGALAVIWRD